MKTPQNEYSILSTNLTEQHLNSSDEINQKDLQPLFDFCKGHQETESQKLIASLMINATHKRFQTSQLHEHIYLKNDEVPQIELFNILIEKFPFVKYSQLISNKAIIESIGDAEEVTILDIGIGQGMQMMQVIKQANQLSGLKKLHIIGIEPFADALQIANSTITSYASNVHFDLSFTGYNSFIEDISFSQLDIIKGKLIVNASLSLHHIQDSKKRSHVISAIKLLNPTAFILIEPNVDHYESSFSIRFMNCYHHYYNIFKVIDRLEIDARDKTGLKLFFGREIEDVIGKEEHDRFEKHEKAICWIERLKENGFRLNDSILKSPVTSAAGVVIEYHKEGFLGFTNEKETVLALMYAN